MHCPDYANVHSSELKMIYVDNIQQTVVHVIRATLCRSHHIRYAVVCLLVHMCYCIVIDAGSVERDVAGKSRVVLRSVTR